MATFADELSVRIKSNQAFWADLEVASGLAMRTLIPGLQANSVQASEPEAAFSRLLRSATILAQSVSESNRELAQDLSLYISVASEDPEVRSMACSVFADIGNHPGAALLRRQLDIAPGPFSPFIRSALLKYLNTVSVGGTDWAFTDFQHEVWSSLPKAEAAAVSAPTSAGKSFVVLEYLCQQAILEEVFHAVYIAPTRALLGEIHEKISRRLGDYKEAMRISTIPTLDSAQKKKEIFILTQERLQVLLATWSGVFDLVIVDEAQAIGDDSRGMILQDCLEEIKARQRKTRFLFLAPGATGFEALQTAIDAQNIDVKRTELSPVVQNRVVVERSPGDENSLDLTLLSQGRQVKIGVFKGQRGFGNGDTILAATALELGRNGGSLVYGTGPANAEKVAGQIASDIETQDREQLLELAQFIKDHVHARYSLSSYVLKGVGFHYGKMPSLLREALEDAFQNGDIRYLVCTTTLFQGVNLPARNVFIDTPTRGRGEPLDAAALWNFAGRAGRLGKEIVGNVFLVGYGTWETQPLTERVPFAITPSFRKTIIEHRNEVLSRLKNEEVIEGEVKAHITEAAAGLLISRAARKNIEAFVERTLRDGVAANDKIELIQAATEAYNNLGLPDNALIVNWTVNPYGQARLLKRFREKIGEGKHDDLIPVHPSPWTNAIYKRYVGIFSRLNREIYGKSASSKFNNRLATDALAWMRGQPLPVIINKRISYLEKEQRSSKVDSTVREVFEFIEDVLRFRYVQLGRCYVDLLRFALSEANMEDVARSVYDFPLALELGVSSIAGQAFVELGLSRITSAALEGLIPDSNPTVERAKEWLSGLTEVGSTLSKVIWNELLRKELVREESLFET